MVLDGFYLHMLKCSAHAPEGASTASFLSISMFFQLDLKKFSLKFTKIWVNLDPKNSFFLNGLVLALSFERAYFPEGIQSILLKVIAPF